jgi:predicted adenylyl cyclase CyaB
MNVRPARNLELKARLSSLETAQERAARIATDRLPDQRQVDTYFACNRGRLKLREIEGAEAQLVWYERPDGLDIRTSDYVLAPVPSPAAMKLALAGALGVKVVVAKRREIHLYHNVRIHLDDVDRLGQFLEFEAVLGPDADERVSRERLDLLCAHFALDASDLVGASYRELMLAAAVGDSATPAG